MILSTPPSTITITQNATATGSPTLTFNGDNGGTQIQDHDPTLRCWYKTNYRGDPREWGAVGDGSNNDTLAIQNWLGAYGVTLSNGATPTNFGPWIAAIPGNYKVNGPLYCPANATLQGGSSLIAGSSKTNATGSPAVRIFAGSSFSGAAALLATGDYCRITGLAFDASNATNGTGGSPIDTILVQGTHNSIDGRALIENGNHNVNCGTVAVDGLQLKDSEFVKSSSDNVYMPNNCSNVRLTGDLIQSSGGNGVTFGGDDLTISGGVIEESQGNGLDLEMAQFVTAGDVYLDQNGKGASGGAAIRIANSNTVSVCGNHIHRSGNDNAGSAHIFFSGTSDNIDFCGDVYVTGQPSNDLTVRPYYVYDADPATVLTNSHFYENPARQIAAVWSPNAVALGLPNLQAPRIVHNNFGGLQLKNDSVTANQVDVLAGAAADSTNSAVIQTNGCNVNTGNNGPGGLDESSLKKNETYFFFVISDAGGSSPSCLGSVHLVPNFKIANFSGTPYLLSTTGWTQSGSTEVYNVSTSLGVVPGIAVDSSDSPDPIPTGTTVSALETSNATATGSWSCSPSCSNTITVVSSSGTIRNGMLIVDTTGGCIPNNALVQSYTPPTITLSANTTCSSQTPTSNLALSSGQQVSLSLATTQTGLAHLKFSTGLYRMVGALYTDATPNIVAFTQVGDTFYLGSYVNDIKTSGPGFLCASSIGVTPQPCALSVPCGRTAATCDPPGLPVEALGRMVGGTTGGDVLIFSPDQHPTLPGAFPGPPGYSITSTLAQTAFPFRVFTDGNGSIMVQAASAGNPVYEVTEGWVFHRAEQ